MQSFCSTFPLVSAVAFLFGHSVVANPWSYCFNWVELVAGAVVAVSGINAGINLVTDDSSLLVVSWADGATVGSCRSGSAGIGGLSDQGPGIRRLATIAAQVAAISALLSASIASLVSTIAGLAAVAGLAAIRVAAVDLRHVSDTRSIVATAVATVAAVGIGIDAGDKGEGSKANLQRRTQRRKD